MKFLRGSADAIRAMRTPFTLARLDLDLDALRIAITRMRVSNHQALRQHERDALLFDRLLDIVDEVAQLTEPARKRAARRGRRAA